LDAAYLIRTHKEKTKSIVSTEEWLSQIDHQNTPGPNDLAEVDARGIGKMSFGERETLASRVSAASIRKHLNLGS
jgi:hypothetical protein